MVVLYVLHVTRDNSAPRQKRAAESALRATSPTHCTNLAPHIVMRARLGFSQRHLKQLVHCVLLDL